MRYGKGNKAMNGLIELLRNYFDSLGLNLSSSKLRKQEDCLIALIIEDLSYYALADNRSKERLRLTRAVTKLNEVLNIYYSVQNKEFTKKEKELLAEQKVNHPKHYNTGSMETIVFLTELGLTQDFCLGNAIKYLSRYRYKGKPVEDLRKALWYVEYLIK